MFVCTGSEVLINGTFLNNMTLPEISVTDNFASPMSLVTPIKNVPFEGFG